MPDIAVLGLLVADIVGLPIDSLPTRGTLALVDRIELHPGGCAANTAIALGKLGIETALLGKVGRDGFGAFIREAAGQAGVNTEGIRQEAGIATAATIVTVHSDAERSFLHVAGANARLTSEDVDWAAAAGAKLFHVAGLQLMPLLEGEGLAVVLAEAKRRGMTTVLDTVMNPRSPGWPGIAPGLPYLDWAVPSFEEAAQVTGEGNEVSQVRRLKSGGAKNVAIKLGDKGCYVAPAESEPFYVSPLPVTAVDTLGAGDAWVAGFLAGLLQNMPLEQTARLANAVGACCVQALGATTGVRSLDETLSLLK